MTKRSGPVVRESRQSLESAGADMEQSQARRMVGQPPSAGQGPLFHWWFSAGGSLTAIGGWRCPCHL
jgi:hypothetical protein